MATDIQAISTKAVTETGRSDKTTLADRAATQAVAVAHKLDFFPKDRIEDNNVVPSTPADKVTQALPTRFRKFALIEPLDTAGDRYAVGKKRRFARRDPEHIFSFEHEVVPEYFYVQGTNVVLESADTINRIRWIWYENPDLSTMTKTTWITDLYQDAMIDLVCYQIYRREGDTKRAEGYLESWLGNPRIGLRGWKDIIIGDNLIEDI